MGRSVSGDVARSHVGIHPDFRLTWTLNLLVRTLARQTEVKIHISTMSVALRLIRARSPQAHGRLSVARGSQNTAFAMDSSLDHEPPDERRGRAEECPTSCTTSDDTSRAAIEISNLTAAVLLYIAYYNWCWRSRQNCGPKCGRFRLMPAMQAGLTDKLWKIDDMYDTVIAA